MTRLLPLIFIFALALHALAEDTKNIVPNGSFEEIGDKGLPAAWTMPEEWRKKTYDEDWMAESEDGKNFLRLIKRNTTDSLGIKMVVPVQKEWTSLEVSLRARLADFEQGPEKWNGALIWLGFLDADGQQIGNFPNASLGTQENCQEWSELRKTVTVPPEAAEMTVQIILARSAGTFDVDDLEIVPVE